MFIHFMCDILQLLTEAQLEKVHNRGLALAEGQSRSFHCKTPDCKGWCIYEDEVSMYDALYEEPLYACILLHLGVGAYTYTNPVFYSAFILSVPDIL